jgi:hypothetical protein
MLVVMDEVVTIAAAPGPIRPCYACKAQTFAALDDHGRRVILDAEPNATGRYLFTGRNAEGSHVSLKSAASAVLIRENHGVLYDVHSMTCRRRRKR